MARNYAQVKVTIWDDKDFLALDRDAQRLYFVLMTRVELSLAGVMEWRPERLAQLSARTSKKDIESAAARLENARFIIIDHDTRECLLRTKVRHDDILRSGPKLAAGFVTAWRAVYSRTLKQAIATEAGREEGVSEAVARVVAPVLTWVSDDVADVVPDTPSATSIHVLPREPVTSNREPLLLIPGGDVTDECTSSPQAPDGAESTDDEGFDDWWSHYPRKVAKGQAAKAYRSARKKTDHHTLVAAITRQASTLTARGTEYCPYPATWLNGERWLDAAPQRDDEIPGVEKWMNP